jgi:hypothetical protein
MFSRKRSQSPHIPIRQRRVGKHTSRIELRLHSACSFACGELTRDPAPTEDDMRAANERMQVAEDPSDDRPISSPTYNNARDIESSPEVFPIQESILSPYFSLRSQRHKPLIAIWPLMRYRSPGHCLAKAWHTLDSRHILIVPSRFRCKSP